MGKPKFKQMWMPLALGLMTLATAYLGNEQYQQSQIVIEAPDVTTNVAITSLPAGAIRSNSDINAMIKILVDTKMKEHETGGKFHG